MREQMANVVAVSRLEARIDPRASTVTVKPLVPRKWDNYEVIPLRQSGPWDTRDLLFVGLSSELKSVGV